MLVNLPSTTHRWFAYRQGDKMARVSEFASVVLVVSYAVGSPAAVRWRPPTIEAPFVVWHSNVNAAAVATGRVVNDGGLAVGAVLRDTILTGTFLGRTKA